MGALLYGLLTPSLYTATAQILVDPRDRQVVSNDVNPSSVSPDGGVTQVESQVSVVQSGGVLLRAIAATDLTNDAEFNGSGLINRMTDFFDNLFSSPSPDEALSNTSAKTLNTLRRRLAVKRADKVLVIDVVVTAKSPDKAARLANAIADAYLADQANARAKAARDASDSLSAGLTEQRRRVEEAENAVEQYKAANNMVMATGRLVSEQQLTDLNNQLSNAQNRAATLKAQIDQITQQRKGGGAADATAEAMQSTVVSKLREQEGVLVERATSLESQLGPRHPAIATVRDQLRNIRQLISAELDRVAKAARADYDRAVANERALSTRLDSLKSQSLSTDQASVRLRELQRDLEAVRSVYANYLQRARETHEQANVDSTNARVITRALRAQQRSWPPLALLLAGAFFGGLGLGAGIALVAEYVSPTVLSSGQIQSVTGAPVIGIVPADKRLARRQSLFRRLRKKEPDTQDDGLPAEGSSARTEAVIGLALRRLFDVAAPARAQNTVRSVLLTSSTEDDAERVRVSRLLAAAAAMRGERVLLIDANVARNQQSPRPGLLEVLRGECPLDAVVHASVGISIALMGKGRQQAVFQESIGSAFARRMLAQARQNFDLVVLDGGAAAENLKAAPLVAAVDELVLVAQLTVTPQRNVTATTQAVAIMGRAITAVLLVDPLAQA
jgi:uncharacterized protein involved in exopolysaccharide biosynthesis/Mrp family chromosome partitioning ATPase